MSAFQWIFPGGAPEAAVTSITLANNTAKTQDVTVPTGERWVLLGIRVTNPDDVQRSVTIIVYKEAAKTNIISYIYSGAAVGASGWLQTPTNIDATISESANQLIKVLDEGYTISVTWAAGGASSGGTDADGLVIEYLRTKIEY